MTFLGWMRDIPMISITTSGGQRYIPLCPVVRIIPTARHVVRADPSMQEPGNG